VKSRNRNIGNLELEPVKFASLKEKLVAEIREELKKRKELPSIIDLVNRSKEEHPKIEQLAVKYVDPPKDMEKIESSFEKTYSLLFGKKPNGGVDRYAPWLLRHTRPALECTSAMSGRKLTLPPHAQYPRLPRGRLLSSEEAEAFGTAAKLKQDEAASLTLQNAPERISKIAFFDVEMIEGANQNIIDCSIYNDSVNCYRSSVVMYTKNSSHCFWPRSCQNIFGCDSPFDSSFSINCYSCTQLSRCFEIDCCGYCSDLYFGHNCENVHESMFCFSMKNGRNCIGNAPYAPDQYQKLRSNIVGQLADELDRNHDLRIDIYNVGTLGRR
jgi:hypothetical protein